MIDKGPPDGSPSPDKINPAPQNGKDMTAKEGKDPQSDIHTGNGKSKPPGKAKPLFPFCPFPACASNSKRHYIRKVPRATDKQKGEVRTNLAKERKGTGPASNTLSPKTEDQTKADKAKTVGRVAGPTPKHKTSL